MTRPSPLKKKRLGLLTERFFALGKRRIVDLDKYIAKKKIDLGIAI